MPDEITRLERQYGELNSKYREGTLGCREFIAAVSSLRVQDTRGTYWQVRADNGEWIHWDGTAWVPGGRPPDIPENGNAGSASGSGLDNGRTRDTKPGLATVRFLSTLGKGMATGFVRHIPLMIGTMVMIWLIHTALLMVVKGQEASGITDPVLSTILILPGNEAAGMMFWGLLVGLIISILSKVRHGKMAETGKKVSTTPDFIKSSFGHAGYYSLFLVLIGVFSSLFIAGVLSNILVSIQLALFMVTSLISQKESLVAAFLRVIGIDIGNVIPSASRYREMGIFWAVTVMIGALAGFLVSVPILPARYTILMLAMSVLTAGILVAILVFSGKKNPAPGGV